MVGLGFKITMGVIMAVQLLAIGYAAHLVRRTKYSVIWILCIVCFMASFAQHLLHIFSDGKVNYELYITLDVILSICLVGAVLFAHRLVNYINHINRQREQLSKQLLSAIIRTEERSRSQFAKELHDGMGPLLSSAKMSLSAISTENMTEHQKDILQNSRFVIDEAIRSVREISNNMSPQVLMDFGLAQGIHNFISRIKSIHTIDIAFETNLHDERFDNDIEVVIYRVVCELINNSFKHSECSNIEVVLMQEGDFLKLRYSDDGKGFNINATTTAKGMGLSNITSRINSLNGSLNISSKSGNGMRAEVKIGTKPGIAVTNRREKLWRIRR